MSLKDTKEHLLELLGDAGNKVIALSGKWGTGKTHLWNEVMASSPDETVNGALYVSLFGLSGIDQVKRKLIESVAPGVEANPRMWEGAKQAVTAGLKALEGFHKGFAALSDLNLLLLAPMMLRGKLIVIDDIERKHDKLGIDEIMGFIDEYTQRHGVRFVLVLNSDQLARRELWDTLREKVIDQELKLQTTPDEAFTIAIGISPSRYAEAIKPASIACGLTNIRIIGKVVKATNRILGSRTLEDALLSRMVPSIVLFSSIHYRGIDDGPDVQFALSINSHSDLSGLFGKQDEEPTELQESQARWRLLMTELNIHQCDEFEALVVDFLESGLFDASKLDPIIDRYVGEKRNFEVREAANRFLFAYAWDHRVTDAKLLEMASELAATAGMLDPYMASSLEAALAEIAGGADIGQAVIDQWLLAFRVAGADRGASDNPFNHPLHSSIAAEFASIDARVLASTTVLDAIQHIVEKSGWGTLQEMAMRNATTGDFDSAIRVMEIDELRRFMHRMIEIRLQNQQSYEQYFGSAAERFVEACKAIANDPASPRLAKVIRRFFAKTSIAAEIETAST